MKLQERKDAIAALPNYVAESLTDTPDALNPDVHILSYKLTKKIKKIVDGEVITEDDGELTLTERWLVHDAGLDTEWIERK